MERNVVGVDYIFVYTNYIHFPYFPRHTKPYTDALTVINLNDMLPTNYIFIKKVTRSAIKCNNRGH